MFRLVWCLCVVSLAIGVFGYPGGYDGCGFTPNHGTSKAASTSYTLALTTTGGAAVSGWSAGSSYIVTLGGASFKGFVVEARRGTTRSSSTASTGTLAARSSSRKASCSSYDQMTHTSRSDKSTAAFTWTAPSTAGIGALSIWATVISAHGESYHETNVQLPEIAQPTPSPTRAASSSPTPTPTTTPSTSPASPSATPSPGSSATPTPSGTPTTTSTPTSSATPTPSVTASPTPSGAPQTAAKVSLVLAISIESIGGSDASSPQRRSFEIAFASDVAGALNISATRITNITATPGSVVVNFVILSPSTSTSAEISTAAAVTELKAQVANSSSALRAGTGAAAQVDATRPVQSTIASSPAGAASAVLVGDFDPSSFTSSAVLSGSKPQPVTFRWSIVDQAGSASKLLRAQLEWEQDSWAAIGFSPDVASHGMTGIHAILALPGAPTAAQQVVEADLFNTTLGGVVVQDSQNLIVGTVRREARGSSGVASRRSLSDMMMRMPWSRKLQSSTTQVYRMDIERLIDAPHPGDMDLSLASDMLIVYAVGGSASEATSHAAMQYHGTQRRGKLLVNLATGDSSAAPLDALVVLHGSLMFLAWGVLLPLGAVSSRLCRNVKPDSGPNARWFCMHWVLQLSGYVSMVAAAITAVVLVANRGGGHFDSPHKALGLVVLLLATMLVIAGKCRPGKDAAIRATWALMHKGGGWLTLVVAVVAILTGLMAAGAEPGLTGAGAALASVGLIVACGGTLAGIGQKSPSAVSLGNKAVPDEVSNPAGALASKSVAPKEIA